MMTESMARRAALMVLGVLAAVIALIGLGQARIPRSCGHRQPALSFLASKLGLGDRSHDEVEAAAARWTTGRTTGDFRLIVDHQVGGTPAAHLRTILGEPEKLSYPRHEPQHAQHHHECWTYHLDGGFLGVVTTDFQEDVVVEFRVERRLLCLAAGTPVLTERGEVPVEALRPEDRLWGFDLNRRERVLARIKAIEKAWAEETVVLGGTLRVSAEHPVFASGAWKPAREVRGGDLLLSPEGKELQAAPPTRIQGRVRVFDIEVEEPHNFIAGGFLVHNKSR